MKKVLLAILVGTMCLTAPSAYAQKKNLVKGVIDAASSKAPAALGAQVERQVARATLGAQLAPYKVVPPYQTGLSLERVKAEALHPQMDISKLVPIRPTDHFFDTTNSALLLVQKSIQQKGGIPRYYSGAATPTDNKVVMLNFYNLLLKDIKGKLSPEEQIQLRYLFWNTNPSISSVERELQSWKDRNGYTPELPTQETLYYLDGVNKPPYGNALEEWALAADVYMLQKLYGTNLPKRIRNAQVLPREEYQQIKAKESFQQKLKQSQQKIEDLRASGSSNWWWTKHEAVDTLYDNEDKLASAVTAFYHYYIDPQLTVFPRAKYLKTSQEGRIYEIPLKDVVLKLEVPGSLERISVTPEEYMVFKADGEKPHLVKRADVELLTDPSSYKLAE